MQKGCGQSMGYLVKSLSSLSYVNLYQLTDTSLTVSLN